MQLKTWIFQEQLKIGQPKRKERAQSEDEDGEHGDKKRRKGGKKKRRDKKHHETEEVEVDRVEYQEDFDERNNEYEDPTNQFNAAYDDGEENVQDPLAAVGLEDSDAEDDMVIPDFDFCTIYFLVFIVSDVAVFYYYFFHFLYS